MKNVVKEKEIKKGVNELEDAFVLWRNKSDKGLYYLSGFTSEKLGKTELYGFFNTKKKNPNEPDVRVYMTKDEKQYEVASLWENVSKKDTRFMSGYTDEKERLVAFYGDENQEKSKQTCAFSRN